MKKFLPLAALLPGLVYVAGTLRAPKNPAALDVTGFSRLPVLVNGRLKPLDTVARSSLLQLQGRQRVLTPDERSLLPVEWLLDVAFRPELADTYKTFEVTHPDLLAVFDLKTDDGDGGKRFSYNQLKPRLAELDRQAKLAQPVEAAIRTPFQRAVVQL